MIGGSYLRCAFDTLVGLRVRRLTLPATLPYPIFPVVRFAFEFDIRFEYVAMAT